MSRTALDRAERLFAAGRNAEVIALLEPQVPVYRESPRFYYILGTSCLRSGDSGGASAYLKRAEQLDPASVDIELALAALDLRKGETDKAIASYLHVLDERPGDRVARRALALLKTEGSPDRIAALVRSGRIARLYPGDGRARRAIAMALAAVALACALAALAPAAIRLVAGLSLGKARRPEVAAISLNDYEKASPVSAAGSFKYVLTEPQALSAFERAKAFFQEYRDNAAIVEINRLLGSNASPSVKQKAASLKAFVGAPDFRTVRDAPSFAELSRDPGLYDGCAVVWKGMAANVREGEASVAFDFLVGYEDKRRLEGIIPASAARGPVVVDRPLEILAVLRSGDGKPRLECVAIHELVAAAPR
jgi:tetratricopeptide (TPR) repeat protein